MNTEESMAEANRILGEAGWIAHPDWEGAYAKGSLVGGIHPDKQGCSIKDWMKIQPGHPLHSADTPDEPHEAAAWLVRSVASSASRETITSEQPVSPSPEPAYDPVHEEASALADRVDLDERDWRVDDDQWRDLSGTERDVPDNESAEGVGGGEPAPSMAMVADDGPDAGAFEADASIDADFTDSPLLSFEGEMAEAEDQAELGYSGPTFIGLDDLDHKRAVAGYRVRQHAKALMPFWTTDHNAALGELRNFAMGVTEGRWPDDGTRREELQALEATAARLNEITAARDEKLAFVDEATRDQIEAFDPEANWP